MIYPQVDEPHQMMDVSSKGCFGQEGVDVKEHPGYAR